MNEDRKRILGMLAAGKITADEAELLLDSLSSSEQDAAQQAPAPSDSRAARPASTELPKFLYVKVMGKDHVDVKVPLALLRAGLKLTSLIPSQAMDQLNESMAEHGMSVDLNNLKPEDLADIIQSLRETAIEVHSEDGDDIRIYCA